MILPSLTTRSLLHSPSATSLHQARTASRTHSSKSHSLGGVISCFLSSTSFCASLWFHPLGKSSLVVPVIKRDGDPTSLDSYRTISALALLPHFPQLDPSQGGFRWGADAMAFSLVDSLRTPLSGSSTLRRLLTPAGSKPLWFVSMTSASRVVYSGIAKGRILSPVLFNLLIDSLAVTLRSTIPCVSLAASDSFRHACQLYADDLVVLTASRWPSTLCMAVGPTKSATEVFGPLCGRPAVSLPLVQQYRYLGVVFSSTLSWPPSRRFSLLPRGSSLSPGQCLVPW